MGIIKKLENWIDSTLLDGKVSEIETRNAEAQEKISNIKLNGHRQPVDEALFSIIKDLNHKT